jgi:hypothetical protein
MQSSVRTRATGRHVSTFLRVGSKRCDVAAYLARIRAGPPRHGASTPISMRLHGIQDRACDDGSGDACREGGDPSAESVRVDSATRPSICNRIRHSRASREVSVSSAPSSSERRCCPSLIQSTPQHFEHRNVGRDLHGTISEFEANLLTYQVARRRCIVCVQQQVHHRLHRRAAARAVGVVARFHSAVPQTFRVISLSAQNVTTPCQSPHKSACLCAPTCLRQVVRSH